jgi:hypothetical protein
MSRSFSKWRLNSVRAADLFGYTRMRLCHRGSAADAVCNMASFSRCNPPRIPVARSMASLCSHRAAHFVMHGISRLPSDVMQAVRNFASCTLRIAMFVLIQLRSGEAAPTRTPVPSERRCEWDHVQEALFWAMMIARLRVGTIFLVSSPGRKFFFQRHDDANESWYAGGHCDRQRSNARE